MTKPTDVNVSPPPSAEVGDDEPPDLNSVLLGFTNYVNNERVRSYNEGVDDTIERCAKEVPTSWLDQLLTGKDIARPPLKERDIEALLRGIQDRIRALKDKP